MTVLWMVQENLGANDVFERIRAVCDRNGLKCQGVVVIPFVNAVPDVKHDGPVLAYGATRFIKNVVDSGKWRPGAFFSETDFTISAALRHWGRWLVNADATILPLGMVASLNRPDDQLLFVRPDNDLKAFAGELMTFRALRDWSHLVAAGQFELGADLPIAVASPKVITAEWRVFAVGGQVVSATRYRLDGRLAPQAGAPYEVIAFVEARLAEWTSAPALALDIAEVDDALGVLEISDLHSAGHYAADVETVIVETSRLAERLF